MSTSALFEVAESQHLPVLVLPTRRNGVSSDIADDTLAEVDLETARGSLLIAPERTLVIAGARRYAWWRVDPKSGDTVAVTDEGLYGAFEYIAEYRKDVFGQVEAVKVFLVDATQKTLVYTFRRAEWGGLVAVIKWLKEGGVILPK